MYIINSEGIAYHQHEVLYINKPQVDARWRVMRYSPKGADDIHDCVGMIRQACGLDKQKQNFCPIDKSSAFVGLPERIRTFDLQSRSLTRYPAVPRADKPTILSAFFIMLVKTSLTLSLYIKTTDKTMLNTEKNKFSEIKFTQSYTSAFSASFCPITTPITDAIIRPLVHPLESPRQ